MEKPFQIQFDYPFEELGLSIKLKATATLHHSNPYYVVQHFKLAKQSDGARDLLPEIQIEAITVNGKKSWVHTDSKRESELSRVVGEAIDQYEGKT